MNSAGPTEAVRFETRSERVRARFENHVIADTADSVTLSEGDAAPVEYFPRSDVETGFVSETQHTTVSPNLGRATYYSMMINGDLQENVAWSYEQPVAGAEAIRGRIAFDPSRVEVYAVSAEETDARRSEARTQDWPAGPDGDTKTT